MSCVNAFATGIKLESSNQRLFLRADQGIKTTSQIAKIKRSRTCSCNLTFDLYEIKHFRRDDQAIKHTFFRSKILIPVANASAGDT